MIYGLTDAEYAQLEEQAFGSVQHTKQEPPQMRRGSSMMVAIPVSVIFAVVGIVMFALGAKQANVNEAEAKRIAAEQETLAVKQTSFAAEWERQAREINAWREQVIALEEKRQAMRKRQIERVKTAMTRGEMFEASLVLLNIGEEISELKQDDEAALALFVSTLQELCDAAVMSKENLHGTQ